MNLEHAKARRLAALSKCNSDRLLVSPVGHVSDLRLPQNETVAAYLIDALGVGCTIEQFAEQTEWSKARIMANLYKVAKKTGIGILRRNDRLHIVWPEGFNETHTPAEDVVGYHISEVLDCDVAA